MPFRFTDYPREDFHAHQEQIEAAVRRVCGSGCYILGEEVAAFEQEFAKWLGVAHVVALGSGTDAVELLLRGLEIGDGDAVAVPSHTAVACISAIMRAGATPVLLDVDPATFTLLPEAVDEALQNDRGIKAVLAVHLYGHPAGMASLHSVCDKHGVFLLEDCAQSHGAMWNGRKTGTLAHGASFSFYPTKNLGALGDGGAVATNDAALAERIREIRQYGWRERYVSAVHGLNSRLDELQAAVLREKLKTLDAQLLARRRLAAIYDQGFKGMPGIIPPMVRHDCVHAFHLYVIRASHRDILRRQLLEVGIPVGVHYPLAVHQQPAYSRLRRGSLKNTVALSAEILSLPLHPYLAEESIRQVVDIILRLPKP